MNKKGFELLWEHMVSILIVVILLYFLFTQGSLYARQTTKTEFVNNVMMLSQIEQKLVDLDLNKGISFKEEFLGEYYDVDVYSNAEWLRTDEISFLENEYILFFSKGRGDIRLTDKTTNSYIYFIRPELPSCYDRACICYVDDLKLWDIIKENNEPKLNLLDENVFEGISLNEPYCITAPNQNSQFIDGRGKLEYFQQVTSEFKSNVNKYPLSLEILSLKAFHILDNDDYFFKQFSKIHNEQITQRLQFEQFWTGGLVLGGFGASSLHSIEYGFDKWPVQIYLTKYNLQDKKYSNFIGVTINSLYSANKDFLDSIIDERAFELIVVYFRDFKPLNQFGQSEVKEYYSKSSDFNPWHFVKPFESAEEVGQKIKINIDFLEGTYLMSTYMGGWREKFETDLLFELPNQTNFCFDDYEYVTQDLILIECETGDKHKISWNQENFFEIKKVEEIVS